jgi:hypothetical protein
MTTALLSRRILAPLLGLVLAAGFTLPASANGCGATTIINVSAGQNPHVFTTPAPGQVHLDEAGVPIITITLGGPCTNLVIDGTAGNDRIVLKDFDLGPILTALTVNGLGGNDTVVLQDGVAVAGGAFMVDGGTGTNGLTVVADESFTLAGSGGSGSLIQSASATVAFQSIGSMLLKGGPSSNTMDALQWSGNGITFRGKGGADHLKGGSGADALFGGPGVDRLDARDLATHDQVNGGGSAKDVCLVDVGEPTTNCELFA